MKSFLQRKANGITLFFFNRVAFPSKFKQPYQKIEFRGFIHKAVNEISEDSKTFKIYT